MPSDCWFFVLTVRKRKARVSQRKAVVMTQHHFCGDVYVSIGLAHNGGRYGVLAMLFPILLRAHDCQASTYEVK